MYWYLFFVVFILLLSIPIKLKVEFKINTLDLSGELYLKIFCFKTQKTRVKIKRGYIYITKKGITYKEKFTPTNIDVVFILNLIKNLYFRAKLIVLGEQSEIGYSDNALITATASASLDIIVKGIFSKIKNNKKYSHIFVSNRAKYNEDCLNCSINAEVAINIFDCLYSVIISKFKSKGVKYERSSEREQSEVAN